MNRWKISCKKLTSIRNSYINKLENVEKLGDELINLMKEQDEMENELADTLARNDLLHETVTTMDIYLSKASTKPIKSGRRCDFQSS